MTASEAFIICNLTLEQYGEVVALWQRAGLHVRLDGRDSAAGFAQQMARGSQRVIGLRLDAAPPGEGSPVVPAVAAAPLVAVAVLTHDGRKGWINRLAVDPAYRRLGLARRLVAEAERWFIEEQGLEVCSALIERSNLASQALFAHEGYQTLDLVYVSKRTRPEA